MKYDPWIGKQRPQAWEAIARLLSDTPGTNWVAMKEAGRRASGMKGESVRSLIQDLRRHGLIEKHESSGYHLTTLGRRLGVRPA